MRRRLGFDPRLGFAVAFVALFASWYLAARWVNSPLERFVGCGWMHLEVQLRGESGCSADAGAGSARTPIVGFTTAVVEVMARTVAALKWVAVLGAVIAALGALADRCVLRRAATSEYAARPQPEG